MLFFLGGLLMKGLFAFFFLKRAMKVAKPGRDGNQGLNLHHIEPH